jgi:HEAT repeat protein
VFRRCVAPCDLPGLERLGDALVHTLNDPEREVRLAALEAIGELRWARALQALTAAYEYYQKGPDALSNLAALARIAHPSSASVFRAALSRNEEAFRLAGAEGLARIGGPDAVFAASALATAQSRDLLVAESFAAVRSGDVRAIDRLIRAVDVGPTRAQARDYLIELGTTAAGPAAAALGSSGPDTRVALIEALSAIGGASELAAVEALRTDKDQKVAAAADRAAMRLAARSGR